MKKKIAVIGSGAWGTALAITADRAGCEVRLWARDPDLALAMQQSRLNTAYLPDQPLLNTIAITSIMADAVAGVDAVLIVVPSQAMRAICAQLRSLLKAGTICVVCAKGIEHESGKLMADIVAEELPEADLAVLSGPTFAAEVAANMPSAVTIASADSSGDNSGGIAGQIALALTTPTFRPYISDDVTGVEIGGAVKNVLAIACGIALGMGLGSNTRAALITRGLEEIKRLSEALGGRRDTVTGLAGLGDLTLTCSSEQSRNFSFGLGLGQGKTVETLLSNRKSVVEGFANAVSVTDLARRLGVEMPISEAVRQITHNNASIPETMTGLMTRPLKAEPVSLNLKMDHPAKGHPPTD